MRWRLAKKLLSSKTTCSLESNKYIKRFQVKKFANSLNQSFEIIEQHCWKLWLPYYLNRCSANNPIPLLKKEILSDGFDGQAEIIAEVFRQ